MKPSLRVIGISLLLAAAVSWAAKPAPAPPAMKVFTVGGVSFSMSIDPRWQVQDPAPTPPNTINVQTQDPLGMSLRMTMGPLPADANPDEFRAWVTEQSRKEFQQQSVEKELLVEPIGKGDVHGSQVCATDRAPKPDEYKYVCQGILTHEGAALIFTMLYNDSGKEDAKQALAALDALQFTQGT